MLTLFTIDTILGNKSDDQDKDAEDANDVSMIEEKNENQDSTTDEIASKETTKASNENEKQNPSYTAIIAQAILSSPNSKLSLGSIYDYIAKNFPDFLKKGQGWRNCVRHNLSLSECFVKAGRAKNGRGNYWGIHPRYQKNFSNGDYRKRRASHRSRQREFDFMFGTSRYCMPYIQKQSMMKNIPKERGSFSIDNILSEEKVAVNGYNSKVNEKNIMVEYRKKIEPLRINYMEHFYPSYLMPPSQLDFISPEASYRKYCTNNLCSC